MGLDEAFAPSQEAAEPLTSEDIRSSLQEDVLLVLQLTVHRSSWADNGRREIRCQHDRTKMDSLQKACLCVLFTHKLSLNSKCKEILLQLLIYKLLIL